MSDDNRFTQSGIFTLVLFALAAASTLGQLGHLTSGHVLLYLAIVLFAAAFVTWIWRLASSKQLNLDNKLPDRSLPAIPPSPAVLHNDTIHQKPATNQLKHAVGNEQELSVQGMVFQNSRPVPYDHDVFSESDDVVWRWQYKPEFDWKPRQLKPHCPECDAPLIIGRPEEYFDRSKTYLSGAFFGLLVSYLFVVKSEINLG